MDELLEPSRTEYDRTPRRHIRIPQPDIGVKLQSLLDDETGNFEYEFNDLRSIVTIVSSDVQYLNTVKSRIELWIDEACRALAVSQTFTVHCATVPVWCEDLVSAIRQVQSRFGVRFSLTDRGITVEEVCRAVVDLKGKKPVFGVLDICEIVVPVYGDVANESRGIDSSTPPSWWCSSDDQDTYKVLEPSESAEMEKLLHFGGLNVKIEGKDFMINFKDKKMKTKTGIVKSFHRVPNYNGVPTQHVRVYVTGRDEHCLQKAKEELLRLLEGQVSTEEIEWSCCSEYSSDIQQQVLNFVRQFCVLVEINAVDCLCSLKVKGSHDYLKSHSELIRRKVAEIVEDVSHKDGISPLLKSPSQTTPKLWANQIDKFTIVDVSDSSTEWKEVLSMMKKTIPNAVLIKLERIQSCDLWEKYKLEGNQMGHRNRDEINEKYLFHGTSLVDPHKIAASEHGIDFRYSNSSKKALMWGQGSYFAENFSYSNMYAYKIPGDCTKKVMLVSVLTGYSISFGNTKCTDLTKPPPYKSDTSRLYDTVNGETGGSQVYVVYDHCKTYPTYILTYKDH